MMTFIQTRKDFIFSGFTPVGWDLNHQWKTGDEGDDVRIREEVLGGVRVARDNGEIECMIDNCWEGSCDCPIEFPESRLFNEHRPGEHIAIQSAHGTEDWFEHAVPQFVNECLSKF
jgi:hypothetical protein